MITIDSPIEPDLPLTVAVAAFAEVALIGIVTPGASMLEVEPTVAEVVAPEVTSASEDAPAPDAIRADREDLGGRARR